MGKLFSSLFFLTFILWIYFLSYLLGWWSFPMWGDFVAYFNEYQNYLLWWQLYKTVSIWYEPWYFLYLYVLDTITNNFSFSFLLSDILNISLAYGVFYFFLGIFWISFRKKIILALIISISVPQFLIFTFSLRKQFFWILYSLLFLSSALRFPKKYIFLSLLFGGLFFAHRGISFYTALSSIIVIFYYKFKFNSYVKAFFISIFFGVLMNISYLTPFIKIQFNILDHTFWALIHNTAVATWASNAKYLARGFDIFWLFGHDTNNTAFSFFQTLPFIFIPFLASFKKVKNKILFFYVITIFTMTYLWSVMAWRISQLTTALILSVTFSAFRSRIIYIFFLSFMIISFVSIGVQKNMDNRYFGSRDSYINDFVKKVPKEGTFIFDQGNPLLGYLGYLDVNSFAPRTTLSSTVDEYLSNQRTIQFIRDVQGLFPLYWYNELILPNSLKWYNIYIVFWYFYDKYSYASNLKYDINAPILMSNFEKSHLFEEILIDWIKDTYHNNYKLRYYPITKVFRVRDSSSIRYVSDNDYLYSVIPIIKSLSFNKQ